MKRSTFTSICLPIAALVLNAPALLERPALAQATPPSSGRATPSSRPTTLERMRSRRADAEARPAKADEDYALAKNAVADIEQKLHALTQRADVSRASLAKAANHMDEEVEALALEQAGADARQKALEVTIAQQAKRAEAAVQADEVAVELQKVVDARTTQVKRMEQLHATGAVPNTDVDGAMAALAEARARLAERRQQTAAAAGGSALVDWNRELQNLSIGNAERRAKLKFLEERRQGLAEALQRSDELSRYRATMSLIESRRINETSRLENGEERSRIPDATAPTTPPQRD